MHNVDMEENIGQGWEYNVAKEDNKNAGRPKLC